MDKVVEKLIEKNITISFAESCTGGALASRLTKTPGVSKIFAVGLVTYSNEAKISYLNVSEETIRRSGVVSQDTAIEMALGLFDRTHANICVSVTGNAGPTSEDTNHCVGDVFVCILYNDLINPYSLHLFGNREENIKSITTFVFDKLDELVK